MQEQEGRGVGIRKDSYAMEIDGGRNCYSCGNFGHLAQNYRNWGMIDQEKRIEYGTIGIIQTI